MLRGSGVWSVGVTTTERARADKDPGSSLSSLSGEQTRTVCARGAIMGHKRAMGGGRWAAIVAVCA